MRDEAWQKAPDMVWFSYWSLCGNAPNLVRGESLLFKRWERERKKKKLSFFFLSFLEVNLMCEHFRQPAISKSSHGEERTHRCNIHVKRTRKRIYSLGYISLTPPAFCKVWNRTKDEGIPVSHSAPGIQSSPDFLAHICTKSHKPRENWKVEFRIPYTFPLLLYAFSK